MELKFVALVLPALVLANIEVNISGQIKREAPNVTVYVAGKDVSIITDIERYTFNMSDNNLKNAVNSLLGKCPHDTYLRVPIPIKLDDNFMYGLQQVTRTFMPQGGKISKVSFKPLVVLQTFFENNSSKPITFQVPLIKNLTNTVSSTWIMEGELSIRQNISYNIKVYINDEKSISFLYNSSWGRNTKEFHTVMVKNRAQNTIVLKPGQSTVAEVHATRCNIQFEIGYEAFLSGNILVYYADLYKGRNYWPLDIVACMNSSGLNNQKVSREVINFELYNDFKMINKVTKLKTA